MSLPVQKSAIERFAKQFSLSITEWFEERVTAAKRGRPVWNAMLKDLRKGKFQGVVIHKIDRSARNLKDWADLGELIDEGIEVRFANEGLDLNSRGGRLSADIQAVVASDYIRNLREEAKKGIYGRLKQGFYPLGAPLGYRDNGAGKAKTIDPDNGPLLRQAFEFYGTGTWSVPRLAEELYLRGLRNRVGGRVTVAGLHKMLRNPFYMGVIRIRASGQTFQGNHQSLISKGLFDRVQNTLRGKIGTRVHVHDFLFRRTVKCVHCGRSLIGELKKGHVYYRCHTKTCPTTNIREDAIADLVNQKLRVLQFTERERAAFSAEILKLKATWADARTRELQGLTLKINHLTDRLNRATDAYIDGVLDRGPYEERRAALISERRMLTDRHADFEANRSSLPEEVQKFVELAGNAYSLYKSAPYDKKRRLLRLIMSNRTADRKTVGFAYYIPFQKLAEREKETSGGPSSQLGRTAALLISHLFEFFNEHPEAELAGLEEIN